MFGWKARKREQEELRAEAERLILQHGVGEALAELTLRSYDGWEDPAIQAEVHALRSAVKEVAGLSSLDTATRYLVLNEQEERAAERR